MDNNARGGGGPAGGGGSSMRTIRFTSLRGENLIPQDGKSCDPYVEIRIGEHSTRTEKISSNHIDPKWSELEGFSFPWDGVGSMPTVEFILWDHDYVGYDDFIGYARTTLHKNMLGSSEVKVRLGIRNDGDKKLLNQYGTLGNLYFTIADAQGGGSGGPSGSKNPADARRGSSSVHGAQNQKRLQSIPDSVQTQKDFFHSTRLQRNPAMTGGPPEFAITTLTCEGLPVDDGTPVFAVMWYVEDEEWRTHPLPVQRGFVQWVNLQFDVSSAIGTSQLRFAIVRRDEQGHLRTVALSSSSPHPNQVNLEVKAMCVPPTQSFGAQTQSSWGTIAYYIGHRGAASSGMGSFAAGGGASQHYQNADILAIAPPQGGMLIRVVEAWDLLPLDYNEDPDPFVVAHWERSSAHGVQEIFRTQTLKSVKDPKWNEVHEIRSISKHAQKLVFSVFDQDPHSLDFAGCCEFDFLNCDAYGSFTFTLYSRVDDPEVTAQDEATLRKFGRQDYGTLTIEWNIDPDVQAQARALQQQVQHYSAAMGAHHLNEPAYCGQHPPAPSAAPGRASAPMMLPSSLGNNVQPYHHHQEQRSGGYRAGAPGPLDRGELAMPAPSHHHGQNAQQHPPAAAYYPVQQQHHSNQQQPQQGAPSYDVAQRVPAQPQRAGPNQYQQQQQPQRIRGAAPPPSSYGPQVNSGGHRLAGGNNGAVLSLTLLSVANISTPDLICPYARVTFLDESKDNCVPDAQLASEAVWNYKVEYFVPDLLGGGGPQQQHAPNGVSPMPSARLHHPQQQQQRRRGGGELLVELCDARSHAVVGVATIDVGTQPHRSRNQVVLMYAPGGVHAQPGGGPSLPPHQRSVGPPPAVRGGHQPVAELSYMIALNAITLPRDIPLNASAMLDLTVIGAHSLNTTNKPNHFLHTNPYVIVTVHSRDHGKTEYRSDVVWNSKHPKWFFAVPQRPVAPSDSVVVSVWDKDNDNFDEFLGQARFSVGTLVQSPATLEIPLEGRPDARGGSSSNNTSRANNNNNMHDHHLFAPPGGAANNNSAPTMREGAFGTLTVEWSVTQKAPPTDPESTAPHMVELAVLDASHLARSSHDTAAVQLSIDEKGTLSGQSMTRVVAKSDAAWHQTFTVQTVGYDAQVRFTVWDEAGRGATFLGECVLPTSALVRTKEHCEAFTLALRPRQDPRYAREDLALLNGSPHGLGALRIEARMFSMQEHERRQRETLRRQGHGYQLVLQISKTADIGPYGSYYASVAAGGEERTSQVESGMNVEFRNNFTFELFNPTEMVVVCLYARSQYNNGRDTLIGDVSFPVKPPSAHDARTDEVWLTLRSRNDTTMPQPNGPSSSLQPSIDRRQNGGGGIGPKPKIYVRWRTFPDTRPMEGVGAMTPYAGPNAPMPKSVDELQRELRRAREELAAWSTSGGRAGPGSPTRGGSPQRNQQHRQAAAFTTGLGSMRPPEPFNVSVYVSSTGQMMMFIGRDNSTVEDAINYCIKQLQTFEGASPALNSQNFQLVFRDNVLRPYEKLSSFVTQKDVVLLQPAASAGSGSAGLNRSVSPVHHHHHNHHHSTQVGREASPHRYGPPQGAASLDNSREVASGTIEYINTRVLHRLQYGESSVMDIVSVFLTTIENVYSSNVSWLVDMCSRHRVSGFCHMGPLPVDGSLRTQFFAQGDPRDVVSLLLEVFAHNPFADLKLEEAYGFIPKVQVGFKWTREVCDLSTMFLHCTDRLSPGSADVWFIHIPAFRDGVGARYVNERGE